MCEALKGFKSSRLAMKSDFMCVCEELIYVDVESKEEFCLNKNCENCVDGTIKYNPEPVQEKYEEIERKLLTIVATFSSPHFLHHLLHVREKLILDFFNLQLMDKDKLYAVDELLQKTKNNIRRITRIKSKGKFDSLINKYADLVSQKNFLDDVLNRRIVITGGRTLRIKYWVVFFEQYGNYGITNERNIQAGNVFQFTNIDSAADLGEEFKPGMDFKHYFKRLFPLMTSLQYMLKYNYRLSKQYTYEYDKRDVAFLLSIFLSLSEPEVSWEKKHFMNHLKKNYNNQARISQFLKSFSTNRDIVPLFVDNGTGFLLTKFSTLFYLCYLIGPLPEMIGKGKSAASEVFVEKISEILEKAGWDTVTNFELYRQTEWEYDIMAFNKKSKKVTLIEVKYRDMSPSSISGKTLIKQQLEGEEGLIKFSEEQKERIKYFKGNLEEFGKKLDCDFKDYDVEGKIITKYTPLIKELNDVEFLSFDEFNQLELV